MSSKRVEKNMVQVASSPCMADELQQGYDGSFTAVDPQQSVDVARWRKAARERLIAQRLEISVAARQEMDARIIATLGNMLRLPGQVVSFYWPSTSPAPSCKP